MVVVPIVVVTPTSRIVFIITAISRVNIIVIVAFPITLVEFFPNL